jgi:ABC-2 type transport system ATP-binding protein
MSARPQEATKQAQIETPSSEHSPAVAPLTTHHSLLTTQHSRPPHPAPAIVFEHVSKWYGPVIGVNQVTLELRPGITGLVGANGAGKSTLLRLAMGQLRPDLGSVLVFGLNAWTAAAKQHVGYCPEIDTFYEEMSGRQFVMAMARLCGYSRAEAAQRTETSLRFVGMADRADRQLRGYSKGMRQRIKVAQALVHDPAVLVLDEPLSGVDPVGRQEFLDLFQQLASAGKCLLVSSHELEELEKLTEHVAIMARGRIAAVGTVSQIRDRLDDHPLAVLIELDPSALNHGGRSGNPLRQAAGLVLSLPDVAGVEMGQDDKLIVRARNPRRFFQEFTRLVLEESLEVRRLETLDDSTHAVLNYLLGGSRSA